MRDRRLSVGNIDINTEVRCIGRFNPVGRIVIDIEFQPRVLSSNGFSLIEVIIVVADKLTLAVSIVPDAEFLVGMGLVVIFAVKAYIAVLYIDDNCVALW
ncbi:MAG: prepilin-type N-terminal cleavage/methylation domain-containing protein [Prevotella sp.]|nr:prepilin-type N-terminal cleavage/methylation domain-containing protein [Prevotella sp.]